MSKASKIVQNLPKMLSILRKELPQWKVPIVGTFSHGANAPFKILISTVLSLRTKDAVTEQASNRLFAKADNSKAMLGLTTGEIEKLIYPVGFYRTKARNVLKICEILEREYKGQVPDDLETLLTFPGVGRKTANLVITVGYNILGICVDTHVHRISNRWGLVKTKMPDETEMVLRQVLPKKYWITFNDILVTYGQNLCVPISPFCGKCKIRPFCPQIGVTTSR